MDSSRYASTPSARCALGSGPGGHSWWDRGRPSAVHALVAILTGLAGANIGTISGGEAVNAIAARAEAVVERRSPAEPDLDAFAAALDALAVAAPLRLTIEPLGRRPAGTLDPGHPLLATVRDVRAGLGLPDVLGDGSTDANAAIAAGIPALCLGCARGRDMHALTERIERASLVQGAAQLEGVLRALVC
jgi:tripeptide aminopeptidase